MQNKTIIKRIAKRKDEGFNMLLMRDCQIHSANQCNGDYYWNEDINAWDGEQASLGEKNEKNITKHLQVLTGTKELPDFIQRCGDPRGFTLYLDSDKLDEEEKALCDSLGLARDWGGNYAITSDDNLPI